MINLERLEGKDIYTFSVIGDIDQEGVEKFYKLLTIKSEEHKELKVLGIINLSSINNGIKSSQSKEIFLYLSI